jgi:hypothetical protein
VACMHWIVKRVHRRAVLCVHRIVMHMHWRAVLRMYTLMQVAAVHVHAACRHVLLTALQVVAV